MDLSGLKAILHGCIGDQAMSLAEDSRIGDIANWDSVAWLTIIAAIDEQFDVVLPVGRLTSVTTVGQLLRTLNAAIAQ